MSFPGNRKQGGKTEPAERLSAFGKGIDLLSRREQSARELKGKLARKGYEKQETEEALEQLQRSDYQNDERFADVLARSRAFQGHGPRRIFAELKSHGIVDAFIASAIAAVDIDWVDSALRQYRRRYGSTRPATAAESAKRSAFLLRRGFDGATVRAVTRAPLDVVDDEPFE